MSIMSRRASRDNSALPATQPALVLTQQDGPNAMFTQDSRQQSRRAGHVIVPVLLGTTGILLAPKLLVTSTTALPISSTVDCVHGESIGTSMNACMASAKRLYDQAADSF